MQPHATSPCAALAVLALGCGSDIGVTQTKVMHHVIEVPVESDGPADPGPDEGDDTDPEYFQITADESYRIGSDHRHTAKIPCIGKIWL